MNLERQFGRTIEIDPIDQRCETWKPIIESMRREFWDEKLSAFFAEFCRRMNLRPISIDGWAFARCLDQLEQEGAICLDERWHDTFLRRPQQALVEDAGARTKGSETDAI